MRVHRYLRAGWPDQRTLSVLGLVTDMQLIYRNGRRARFDNDSGCGEALQLSKVADRKDLAGRRLRRSHGADRRDQRLSQRDVAAPASIVANHQGPSSRRSTPASDGSKTKTSAMK